MNCAVWLLQHQQDDLHNTDMLEKRGIPRAAETDLNWEATMGFVFHWGSAGFVDLPP